MTRPPAISIALCTYNGAMFLRDQLDSLLAQDHRDFEIVAVDDASTDDSASILQDYARRDSRISVHVNPSNVGFRRNFARALERCAGAMVAPCDQDDIWELRKLSRLAGAIGGRALAYCDSALTDAQGSLTGGRISDRFHMVEGDDPRVFTFQNCISGHAMLFRRELLGHALPMPDGVYHDWWLAFMAAAHGGITYVDEPLVRFRQHAGAASGFTRAGAKKPRKSAWDRYRDESRSLEALVRHAPPAHRAFFEGLRTLWQARAGALVCPRLAGFLMRHARVLYAMRRGPEVLKWRHAFKHLWGLRWSRERSRLGAH